MMNCRRGRADRGSGDASLRGSGVSPLCDGGASSALKRRDAASPSAASPSAASHNGRVRFCLFLCAFAALSASALEVPVFEDACEEFLKMTPAERRAKFTDKEWRTSVVQAASQTKWREAREGEGSRWRRMDGVRNVRDLGGLKGLGGKTVVTGRVYRTAQFNGSARYRLVTNEQQKAVREYYGGCKPTLTPDQVAAVRATFGIRTDLDLRGAGQCNGMTASPLGGDVRFVCVAALTYGGVFKGEGAKRMAECLRVFADEANYPIAFHCAQGADRTGSLAFVLEALLGVSAEDRVLDWELTAFANPNPKFAHVARYDKLTAGLAKFPGATDAEKAEAYAKSIGVTDAEIAAIRRLLLK